MEFKSFTDLVNTMAEHKNLIQNFDINGMFNGDIVGKHAQYLQDFYQQWSVYLDPVSAIMSVVYTVFGWLAKALFVIANAMENVFNSLFKLFGLFGYLGDSNTLIGKLYFGMQIVGLALFVLILTFRVITGLLSKPLKYKDTLNHIMLVTIVVSVLPLLVNVTGKQAQEFSLTKMVSNEATSVQQMSGGAGKDTVQSLASQPFASNVVDLKYLTLNNFDTSKFKLDGMGYLKPDIQANYLSSDKSSINYPTRIKFGSTLGVTNPSIAENWEKANPKLDGVKGLFEHKLNDDDSGIDKMSEHRFFKGMNALEAVYLRYKVNWWALYAQLITIIVLLVLMSVKFVKSLFELVITGIIAPIQGYSSVESSKKFKELLMTMVGTLAGMFFEVVILRVTLEIMRDAPAMIAGNLTGFEQTLGSIIIYLGTFFGALQGVAIIERWLGVSTSQNASAQQLMGAMMALNTTTGAVRGTGKMALGATKLAGAAVAGLPGAVSGLSHGMAKTAGAAQGLATNVAQQGLGNTLKGGLYNVDDKVSQKAQELKGGLENSFEAGKTGAQSATENRYPTEQDQLQGKVADKNQAVSGPNEANREHNAQTMAKRAETQYQQAEAQQQIAGVGVPTMPLGDSDASPSAVLNDVNLDDNSDSKEEASETSLDKDQNQATGLSNTTESQSQPQLGRNLARYSHGQGLSKPENNANGSNNSVGISKEEPNKESANTTASGLSQLSQPESETSGGLGQNPSPAVETSNNEGGLASPTPATPEFPSTSEPVSNPMTPPAEVSSSGGLNTPSTPSASSVPNASPQNASPQVSVSNPTSVNPTPSTSSPYRVVVNPDAKQQQPVIKPNVSPYRKVINHSENKKGSGLS